MRNSLGLLAGAVTLSAALAIIGTPTGAAAQSAPRGKQAGDFLIGLGAIGVLPSNGGSTSIGGTPARLKKSTKRASAFSGSFFENWLRLAISVTGRPSRSIERMKAKVPTFIVT